MIGESLDSLQRFSTMLSLHAEFRNDTPKRLGGGFIRCKQETAQGHID
jgi:hypothetical protein